MGMLERITNNSNYSQDTLENLGEIVNKGIMSISEIEKKISEVTEGLVWLRDEDSLIRDTICRMSGVRDTKHVVPYSKNDSEKLVRFSTCTPFDLKNEIEAQDILDKNQLNGYSFIIDAFNFEFEMELYRQNKECAIIREVVEEIEEDKGFEPTEIVNNLIDEGISIRASDIHVEPLGDILQIRFRVDGVLVIARKMNLGKYKNDMIITKFKLMADLRPEVKKEPQEGAIYNRVFKDKRYDLRVSILPTVKGEKVALRIFDKDTRIPSLKERGFSDKHIEELMADIRKPTGLILVTGATGSGKTNTLYSLVNSMDKKGLNINMVEDPVEQELDGVNQVCIKTTGTTFESNLKSLLRQDPDVIIVGEGRDKKVLEIIINASFTGHLVLSSLHTNDATKTFDRLLSMGIEPYQIVGAITGILNQRLVKVLCEYCKEEVEITQVDIERMKKLLKYDVFTRKLENIQVTKMFKSVGCKHCSSTGYYGRTAIAEYLRLQDMPSVKSLILQSNDLSSIKDKAVEEGMSTIEVDAVDKVLQGYTTIQEVERVFIGG